MSADEIETRARTMGWLPKEEFTGKAPWVDAETYVERGEQILPMLKANNKKLSEELTQVRLKLQTTEQVLADANAAIDDIKTFRSQLNKEKVEASKQAVLDKIKQAKTDGDVDAEVQLTDQLTEINGALKEAAKPVEKKPVVQPAGEVITPEGKTWLEENKSWFGVDMRKTGYAMGLSREWVAQGKATGTAEYFEHVDAELAKVFDPNMVRRQRPSKVEGAVNGDSGVEPGDGKSYADLPREAKDACERQAARLVGPGRKYKTKAEWQKAFVEIYDWS
jgi:hypothetical protein